MLLRRPGLPLLAVLFAALLLAVPLVAEPADLQNHPGFVAFERPSPLTDDDLDVHVSVKGPMIQLIANASRENDPILADVLSGLLAVEVWVYNVPEDFYEAVRANVRETARQLSREGWDEAIAIRVKSARGHVFLRLEGDAAEGIAALYFDDEKGEAVQVNIVGRVDPAQLGRLANRFNLDLLGEAAREQMSERPENP